MYSVTKDFYEFEANFSHLVDNILKLKLIEQALVGTKTVALEITQTELNEQQKEMLSSVQENKKSLIDGLTNANGLFYTKWEEHENGLMTKIDSTDDLQELNRLNDMLNKDRSAKNKIDLVVEDAEETLGFKLK